jgi:hypothetical protein
LKPGLAAVTVKASSLSPTVFMRKYSCEGLPMSWKKRPVQATCSL